MLQSGSRTLNGFAEPLIELVTLKTVARNLQVEEHDPHSIDSLLGISALFSAPQMAQNQLGSSLLAKGLRYSGWHSARALITFDLGFQGTSPCPVILGGCTSISES